MCYYYEFLPSFDIDLDFSIKISLVISFAMWLKQKSVLKKKKEKDKQIEDINFSKKLVRYRKQKGKEKRECVNI